MAKKTEVAAKATFTTDDKRAQYALLAVFNHGVAEKVIAKGTELAAVTQAAHSKAWDSLAKGNLLDGKEGIELIQKLTKGGATDENVAKRGLTTAYAQEVRPFLRRGELAATFGRRAKEKTPEQLKAIEDKKAASAAAAKKKADAAAAKAAADKKS